MNRLRAFRTNDAAESGPLHFIASTPGVKRDGLDLDQGRWNLTNYQRNPVFLWGHDYNALPIGRADVNMEAGELRVAVTFDDQDEFARQVESKYRRGYLNAVSVGWDDVDEDGAPTRVSRKPTAGYDLLDVSAVTVPGDPDALLVGDLRHARAMHDQLTDILSAARPLEFVTDPTAADGLHRALANAMLATMYAAGSVDEKARQYIHNQLERAYAKLGLVAPEFRDAATVHALRRDELVGLFVEGERAFLDAPERPQPQAPKPTPEPEPDDPVRRLYAMLMESKK